MDSIRLFDNSNDYSLVEKDLLYPCVSYISGGSSNIRYKGDNSISCKYCFNDDAINEFLRDGLSEITLFDNSSDLLKSYSIDGVSSITYDSPIIKKVDRNINYLDYPILYTFSFDSLIFYSSVSTSTTFSFSSDFSEDDILVYYEYFNGKLVNKNFYMVSDFLNIDNHDLFIIDNMSSIRFSDIFLDNIDLSYADSFCICIIKEGELYFDDLLNDISFSNIPSNGIIVSNYGNGDNTKIIKYDSMDILVPSLESCIDISFGNDIVFYIEDGIDYLNDKIVSFNYFNLDGVYVPRSFSIDNFYNLNDALILLDDYHFIFTKGFYDFVSSSGDEKIILYICHGLESNWFDIFGNGFIYHELFSKVNSSKIKNSHIIYESKYYNDGDLQCPQYITLPLSEVVANKIYFVKYNLHDGSKEIGKYYSDEMLKSYRYSGLYDINLDKLDRSKNYFISSDSFTCSDLSSIIIPSCIKELNNNIIDNRIHNIYINSIKSWCLTKKSFNDKKWPIGVQIHLYLNNKELRDIIIPSGVYRIEDYGFAFTHIDSISLPNDLVYIGNGAFRSNSLSEIVLPNSLKLIGEMSFGYCGISEYILPDSLESIGDLAFAYNSSLTSVTFGNNSNIVIGNDLFIQCTSLRKITFTSSIAPNVPSDIFTNISSSGILYYPTGSDYSSIISILPTNWIYEEI